MHVSYICTTIFISKIYGQVLYVAGVSMYKAIIAYVLYATHEAHTHTIAVQFAKYHIYVVN